MGKMTFTFSGGTNNMTDPTAVGAAEFKYGNGVFTEALDLYNVDVTKFGGAVSRDHYLTPLPTQDSVTLEGITFTATSEYILGTTVKNTTDVYEDGLYDAPFDGGIAVEFFGSRVYRAGLMDGVSVVAFSKPGEFYTQDVRDNVAMMSGNRITMLGRVDDGLFVGTDTEVLFLSGTDPVEGEFQFRQVLPYGVIQNTCQRTTGSKVQIAQMSGSVIVFATYQGVVVGGNGGKVVNLSEGKVSYAHGTIGASLLREEKGEVHYIFNPDAGMAAHNPYISDPTIEVDSQ